MYKVDVSTLKALTFDAFGTVVDWPSTVIQETEQLGQAKGIKADWAKCAGLPWDCVLSAELAKYYKPAPEVYQVAADLLGLPPNQMMMVAAHKRDLKGARAIGMETAFIPRPMEYGTQGKENTVDESWLDL